MTTQNDLYQPPQRFAVHAAAADHAAIAQRIKKLNNTSFVFGVPGLILQVVGARGGAGLVALLAGTALLVVGLGFYARSRGQHPAFGAFGLLSIVGLIVLAVLPRNCLACSAARQKGHCERCGAPVAP